MIRSVTAALVAAFVLGCGDSPLGGSGETLPETPEEVEALGQECVNLLANGRFEEAAETCQRAARAAPDDEEMATLAEDAVAAAREAEEE